MKIYFVCYLKDLTFKICQSPISFRHTLNGQSILVSAIYNNKLKTKKKGEILEKFGKSIWKIPNRHRN